MAALLIGYARYFTDQQDLTVQRDGLAALGVALKMVHVDHGLTGTNRERSGLREALAAYQGRHVGCDQAGPASRSLPTQEPSATSSSFGRCV